MFGLLTSLLVTAGALILALRMLRKLHGTTRAAASNVPLALLQRMPVAPRQAVALLQVGERVLLVSLSEGGVRLLTELDADTSRQALAPADVPARPMLRGARSLLGTLGLAAVLMLLPATGSAQTAPPARRAAATQTAVQSPVRGPKAPTVQVTMGSGSGQLQLSGAVGVVAFLGFLTLLPAIVLLMTSFTRIMIVLQFLRSALGTQTTPPTQLLAAIAVLLSGIVMGPIVERVNRDALQPYFRGEITQAEAYGKGIVPLREFMLANTRERDLATFTELSGADTVRTVEEIPIFTLTSAFVTSELRTAFQMGFVIFLPFIVIDLVVASVLMSMGMFMLPPVLVSLPFKLLLFVLADGWTLVVQNLVASFRI